VARKFAHPQYPLVQLKELVTKVQYGSSSLATDEPVGVPILRMNNLQKEGWDLSDLKYIDLPPQEFERYRLNPGDILFNRTNSKELVGKCEVFREEGNWVFASYLIRIVLDEKQALPDFVSNFLNTLAGRAQIDQKSRQIIGMANINAQEIRNLEIPLPPLDIQQRLVAEMEAARAERKAKLEQADRLLAGMDDFVMEQLGLQLPPAEKRLTFAVRLGDASKRFDVDYHKPQFRILRSNIDSSVFPITTIGAICENIQSGFAAGSDNQAFDSINGIPHIRPLNITSHAELTLESTKYVPHLNVLSADLITQGEVLFNNTNSSKWVGKSVVFDVEYQATCSNHVTRLKLIPNLSNPYFIAGLLNVFRGIGLFELLSTNFNNQAGVNTETLSNLKIPLPNMAMQNVIASEIKSRRTEARRLRAEAEAGWQMAKARFEAALLGDG